MDLTNKFVDNLRKNILKIQMAALISQDNQFCKRKTCIQLQKNAILRKTLFYYLYTLGLGFGPDSPGRDLTCSCTHADTRVQAVL